jgi:hypothetical protein
MKRLITITDKADAVDELFGVTPDGDPSKTSVILVIRVTSLTGTSPTLDVEPRIDVDGDIVALNDANLFAAFSPVLTQFTTAGDQEIRITNCPQSFQINLNFGGTVTDCDLTISGERV